MKSRPILFSGEMVRALLAGTKTQTRRIVKPQPKSPLVFVSGLAPNGDQYEYEWVEKGGGYEALRKCPDGCAGDQLWVRETFGEFWGGVKYRATDDRSDLSDANWKPSIFMPRKFSRITLEIVEVRCELVRDISPQDVVAEGFPFHSDRDAYSVLWNTINGPGSWESNPWCWAISFKRLEQP